MALSQIAATALCHLLAFFLGAIPVGFLVGRVMGADVRKQGSGNVGATNVGRLLGKKAGVITLLGDMIKGAAAVGLALLIFPSSAFSIYGPTFGAAAIAGHCFSPFLRFRGGKGVATSLGVFLILATYPTLAAVAVFALALRCFGYVSLSSLSAAAALPILLGFQFAQHNASPALLGAAIAAAALIFLRHSTNISRLRLGTEKKFSFACRTAADS